LTRSTALPETGITNALADDGVTLHSGDMGDTSPPRRGHALEGVSRGGRASPVRCPLDGEKMAPLLIGKTIVRIATDFRIV
jgi:hypothetical protein